MAVYFVARTVLKPEEDNNVVKWLNPLCHYNGECFEMNHPEK